MFILEKLNIHCLKSLLKIDSAYPIVFFNNLCSSYGQWDWFMLDTPFLGSGTRTETAMEKSTIQKPFAYLSVYDKSV